MQFIFTRHGESDANIQRIISNRDLPHALTEKGRLQAQRLADQLAQLPILAIYASPILRAQQTAEIVAGKLGLSFTTSDALREFDCGIMEGRGDADAWQAHELVVEAWGRGEFAARIPEGESFDDMERRFVSLVEALYAQYAGEEGSVVLVAHGSLLHNTLPHLLRNVDRSFSQQHPLSNCACVFVAPQAGEFVCLEWNGVKV